MAAFCVLSVLLAQPARSQSAANFKTNTPKVPETKATSPAKDAKPAEIPSSRYVTAENLPAYVNTLSSILTIRKRATDPFGQYQDPDAKPLIKPTVKKIKRYARAKATPFSEIVRLMKVTTVMPAEKSFLIGTRTFSENDRIPLSFRGKTITVQVSAVTSSSIEFRNIENDEQASLPLDLLPVGMTPGNSGITAPGMVADRPDAPIDLDAESL